MAVATTASFSMGLREQVEYTSLPPGASNSRPRFRIRSCNLQQINGGGRGVNAGGEGAITQGRVATMQGAGGYNTGGLQCRGQGATMQGATTQGGYREGGDNAGGRGRQCRGQGATTQGATGKGATMQGARGYKRGATIQEGKGGLQCRGGYNAGGGIQGGGGTRVPASSLVEGGAKERVPGVPYGWVLPQSTISTAQTHEGKQTLIRQPPLN